MKITTGLTVLLICCAMFMPVAARAERFGHEDSHHVWHDAGYWHEHHPDWVYRYHPEWAVERQEWWEMDHRDHPEWFASPFWGQYPVWTYGDYDEHHVWHYAGWWHERNPEWFYAHHPGWAEAYPGWMRRDHELHGEWFRGAYWQEHRHDWNHPDEAYRHAIERSNDFQRSHFHEEASHNLGGHEMPGNHPGHPYDSGPNVHPHGPELRANSGFHQQPPGPHPQVFGNGGSPPTFHAPAPPAQNFSHASSGGGSKRH